MSLEVIAVPADVRSRLHLADSYTQFCSAGGLPIVGSAKPSPYAIKEAAFLIDHMLTPRPDVRQAMIDAGVRCTVMAYDELTTDVPEHSDLTPKAYWDKRARGLGATPEVPCVSCAEENLLCLDGDPYRGENILIHEFGHAVHEVGMRVVDPTFDGRLKETYDAAMSEGLWAKTYAATNRQEYWAEGTQSWFDCNASSNAWHNDVDTRGKLKAYDPRLARLLAQVYGDDAWRYTRPTSRPVPDHLAGFDRARAPRFQWPARASTTPPASSPAATQSTGR